MNNKRCMSIWEHVIMNLSNEYWKHERRLQNVTKIAGGEIFLIHGWVHDRNQKIRNVKKIKSLHA